MELCRLQPPGLEHALGFDVCHPEDIALAIQDTDASDPSVTARAMLVNQASVEPQTMAAQPAPGALGGQGANPGGLAIAGIGTWPPAVLVGFALLGLCWLALFNGLGSLGLMDKTEALFVEVAHQMLLRDDWVTPIWNGSPFFDYPVWGYLMVALSFRLFGISEWAARLPGALAATAVVLASFGLLWCLVPASAQDGSKRLGTGLIGACLLATTPGWIGWGRTATTDMFLASAITLALYGFALVELAPPSSADRWRQPLGRVCLAGFCGIAVLAKGPVGLLLPGLVIGSFLSLRGGWRRWLAPGPLAAMAALFFGICLPWYWLAAVVNGQAFLGGFLGFSNLQRFTSVLYAHPGPFWFYLPWLLMLVFPWSAFLPLAIARSGFWQPSNWRRLKGGEALPLLLVIWLGVILAFFSAAATKLPGYILPALPATTLLVAWLFTAPGAARQGWPLKLSGGVGAVILALAATAVALAPDLLASDPAYPKLAAALRQSGLPFALATILGLTALGCFTVLGLDKPKRLWIVNLAGFLTLLAVVIAPLADLLNRQRQQPLQAIQIQAGRLIQPGEPLWVIGTRRYSTLFYAKRRAVFLGDAPEARKQLASAPASVGVQPSTRSVLLLGDRAEIAGFGPASAQLQLLAKRGEQELWRLSLQSPQPGAGGAN